MVYPDRLKTRSERLFYKLELSIEALKENGLEVGNELMDFMNQRDHVQSKYISLYEKYIEDSHSKIILFLKKREDLRDYENITTNNAT